MSRSRRPKPPTHRNDEPARSMGEPLDEGLRPAEPGMDEPGMNEPGRVEQGMIEPGMVEPGDVEQGVVEPGAIEPAMIEQGMAGQGISEPGMADPVAGSTSEPVAEPPEPVMEPMTASGVPHQPAASAGVLSKPAFVADAVPASEDRAETMRSGAADDRPAYTPPPPAPVAAAPSFWPAAIAGGLIGGIIAAGAGGWYLSSHAPIPAPLQSRIEALGDEIGAVRENSQASAATLGAFPDRINAVEQTARDLRGQFDGARASADVLAGDVRGRLDELRGRVDALAGQIAPLASASTETSQAAERLAQLGEGQSAAAQEAAAAKARLDALAEQAARGERELAALRDGVRGDLERVVQELRTLREAQAGLAAGPEQIERLAQGLREIGERQAVLAGLTGVMGELRDGLAGQRQEVTGVEEKVAAVQEGVGSVQESLTGVQEKVAGLEENLAGVEGKVTGVRGEVDQTLSQARQQIESENAQVKRTVGLAVALLDMRTAVEEGGSLGSPLALVRELGQGEKDLGGILDQLGQGEDKVPTLAELARQLDEVAAAGRGGAAEPAGWAGSARKNLGTLLTVVPSDGAQPAERAVTAARTALLDQDLGGAIVAVQPLADGGNAAAKDWVGLAKRRQAAMQAVDELAALLKTRLAQGG